MDRAEVQESKVGSALEEPKREPAVEFGFLQEIDDPQ